MPDFFVSILEFFQSTQISEQIREVDVLGLFSNAYFLVPFIGYVGYLLYKQSLNGLVIIGLVIGLWIFSGSNLMQGLVVNGEIQIGKILPVAAVGIGAIAVAIYFLFMRSD